MLILLKKIYRFAAIPIKKPFFPEIREVDLLVFSMHILFIAEEDVIVSYACNYLFLKASQVKR